MLIRDGPHSGFGYKKDDPTTWKTENLPVINEKGSKYCEM